MDSWPQPVMPPEPLRRAPETPPPETLALERLTLETTPPHEISIDEPCIVIGIDYGTTYTGVAFATVVESRANLGKIHVITNWGSEMDNVAKIPSVISYSPASTTERQWGSDLSRDAVAMVHTKLQLGVCDTSQELEFVHQALNGMGNLDFQYIEHSQNVPKYTWKGPEEIIGDYFEKVCEWFRDYIRRALENVSLQWGTEVPIDIVVTVPAEWNYRAKNSTFRALTKGGFNKEKFPRLREMLLVSEPMAAAIFTARYLKEQDPRDIFRVGECFVLCDAGGGTVDVISYQILQLHPTFEIKPITDATGSRCGAVFIDLAFKKWIRDLLGEKKYQKLDKSQLPHKMNPYGTEGAGIRALMERFDRHKRMFSKDQLDIKIDLPSPLHDENIKGKVVGGEITITNQQMRDFFAPCVEKIMELIHGQLTSIEMDYRTRPKHVFLVGGFAESKYLQEEIGDSLDMRGGVKVVRPDTQNTSWTAVVRGAVVYGIEKLSHGTPTSMSACPQSLGFPENRFYEAYRDDPRDHLEDPNTGALMARDQLKWLVKKGDLILSDEPREVEILLVKYFPDTGPRRGTITIYSYHDEDDDLPDRLSNRLNDLNRVRTLEYDMAGASLQRMQLPNGGSIVYPATLRLIATLRPQVLELRLCWENTVLCAADIRLTFPV